MCGRITLAVPSPNQLALELQATLAPGAEDLYRPRYNVAPTSRHWMVDAKRVLTPATWGFASRGGRLLINARSETAAKKPSFRRSFQERRCAIPADGFYEWEGPKNDRRPIWFHPPDGGLLLFAGLWEQSEGEAHPRFTVLTTEANDVVGKVHDRMPVILPLDRLDEWLEAPTEALLGPAPNHTLAFREVSTRVNSVANDDPGCLGPPEKKRVEQLSLL